MTSRPGGRPRCEPSGDAEVLGVLQRPAQGRSNIGGSLLRAAEDRPESSVPPFKKIGKFWSARVGLHHRALAVEDGENRAWFWIGTHAEYDHLLGRQPANKRLQPTAASRTSKKRSQPPRLKRSR